MNSDSLIRSLRALALTALVASTGCAAESVAGSEDGPTASTEQAITNGDDDAADPAVVALLIGGKVFCSGVLITSNVVVTAAHCVAPGPPEQVYFGAKPSLKKGGTFIDVSDSKVHPEFDEDTLVNDIAVIGLASKAPVAPAPVLTTPFDDSFKNLPIRLVGFGVTGDGTENLRKRTGATTITSFGAEDFRFKPGPSQTCNGDSGGPALANIGGKEAVIGIASSGDSNCKTYGRHIRIDANLAFIQGYSKAYAKRQNAGPVESSGCSMTSRTPGSTSSTAALVLAVACAAALRTRRRASAG